MAKRGNDDSQDSATAAPALRLSPNFQSSSADIELRSKDGVRFLVHKANLAVSSKVFADMSEAATGGDQDRPEHPPGGSAAILERLLSYCYPQVNPAWDLDVEDDRDFVSAIDKYHVPRAIEAGATSLYLRYRGTRLFDDWKQSPGFQTSFTAFSYATRFGLEDLAIQAFPCLLIATRATDLGSHLQWMLSSASPDGLTWTDKLRLIAFLTLLNTAPADRYRESLVTLQGNISDQTRVPCDSSRRVLVDEDDDDVSTHAVGRLAMEFWTRLERQPVASWFAEQRLRLHNEDAWEDEAVIECDRCKRVLLDEFDYTLEKMQKLEAKEGLKLEQGKETEWLGQYRAWVRRKFGEAE